MLKLENPKFGDRIIPILRECGAPEEKLTKENLARVYSLLHEKVKFQSFNVQGVQIPKHLVIKLFELEVSDITSESNAEIRRILMEFYGITRFLNDGGAELHREKVHAWDYPHATVYKLHFNDDIHYALKLINQTKEPQKETGAVEMLDEKGNKIYWLWIPDPKNLPTMYDIVGETFGYEVGHYVPDVEA